MASVVTCQTKVPCDSSSSSSSYLTNVKFSSKPLYPSILPLQMTKKNPNSHVLTKRKDSTTRISGATTSTDVQVIHSLEKEKDETKIVNPTFAEFILENLTYVIQMSDYASYFKNVTFK